MKYFFCDTETATMTGPIVDLAVIEVNHNLDIIGTYESLVDPVVEIVPAAEAVHNISKSMVEDAPTMEELIARDGSPFAADEPITIIAHNCQFDARMLEQAKLLPAEYRKVCTLRIARNLYPDLDEGYANHKLGTLAVMFGLERGPAHRAMGDTVTCLNLMRHFAEVTKASSIEELMELGTRSLSLETKISFGKHKGTKLKDLPLDYVRWMCNQSDMDVDLRTALSVRLQKS